MRNVSVSANWGPARLPRLFWTDNVLTTQDDYTLLQSQPARCLGTDPHLQPDPAKRGLLKEVDKNQPRTGAGTTARRRASPRAPRGTVFGGTSIGRQVFRELRGGRSEQSSLLRSARRIWNFRISAVQAGRVVPLPFQVQISGSWRGYLGFRRAPPARMCCTTPHSTGSRIHRSTSITSSTDDRPELTAASVDRAADSTGLTIISIAGTRSTCGLPGSSLSAGRRRRYRFDVFNLLNANTVLSEVETSGVLPSPELASARPVVRGGRAVEL